MWENVSAYKISIMNTPMWAQLLGHSLLEHGILVKAHKI
jgi:hypothetical protein